MHDRNPKLLLILVVSLGLAGWGLLHLAGAPGPTAPFADVDPAAGPPAPDRGDDPDGRRNFEFMRTRNPVSGQIPPDIHRLEQEFAAGLPQRRGSAVQEQLLAKAGAGDQGTWASVGPNNVGGRTRALAIDRADPTHQTLLAGGVSGGMWRTTDGGATWSLRTGSSQLHSVMCIVQDPRPGFENEWYYGTGELRGNSANEVGAVYRGDGIFHSVDGGLTWSLLPSTSTQVVEFDQDFDYMHALAMDPTNVDEPELYAATYGGIYRSVDRGSTWNLVLGDTATPSAYTHVEAKSDGTIIATLSSDGGLSGIFQSADGLTWNDITPSGMSPSGWGRIVTARAPSNENIVYALACALGSSQTGLWRYDAVADQWSNRSGGLSVSSLLNGTDTWTYESYRGYCQMLAVHPNDPDIVYVGGIYMVRSTDGFATDASTALVGGWEYPEDAPEDHHADIHVMCFAPGSGEVAYTASDGGVHRTDNATQPGSGDAVEWTSLNNGYNTTQFYTTAIEDREGSPYVVGGLQDNGSVWHDSSVPGGNWVSRLGGDGAFCGIAYHTGTNGVYYFSFQYGVIYRYALSPTGGSVNWRRVDPETGSNRRLFINPFLLSPTDYNRMYFASENGVYRGFRLHLLPIWGTSAATERWVRITVKPLGEQVSALAASHESNPTLYYGTEKGSVLKVFESHTAAQYTEPIDIYTDRGLPADAYVMTMDVHPNDPTQVLLGFSNYGIPSIFHSSDGGDTWVDVEGNLAGVNGPSIRSAAFLPTTDGDIILLGTSTGLYSTMQLDGAQTVWALEAPDLIGNVVVDMVKARASDGFVAAATHGRGVFTLTPSTGVDVPELDAKTALAQNAPNPFNPSTEIRFDLERAGPVSLDVYDARGRRVATLVDGARPAGANSVAWDGRDDGGRRVASGVYRYVMRHEGGELSRSMTLVK